MTENVTAMASNTVLAHFKNVFRIFIGFGEIQPTIKAIIYWVIVVIGSLINDFHRPPESYFSSKQNVFNVVFVKSSLLWTLAFVVPFVALTSMMKSQGSVSVLLKDLSRILVVIGVWYVVTTVFDFVLDLTGVCEGSELFSTKETCQADGLIWVGFDISGHCFLLSYCSLVLSEEIQAICFWHDNKHSSQWKCHFKFGEYLANILYVCCCLLILLWEGMLACTSIYFHTVDTKIIGIFTGLMCWTVTYKLWYEKQHFSPGIPTEL